MPLLIPESVWESGRPAWRDGAGSLTPRYDHKRLQELILAPTRGRDEVGDFCIIR